MPVLDSIIPRNDAYKNQLIIHFGHSEVDASGQAVESLLLRTGKSLANKWNRKHTANPCQLVKAEDLHDLPPLTQSSGLVRIYLVAHGEPAMLGVEDDLKNFNKLKHIVEGLTHIIGNANVVVNLISCCSARGQDNDFTSYTSFAAALHAQLYSTLKRDILVVGRLHVMIAINNNKKVANLNFSPEVMKNFLETQIMHQFLHRQPGSKVIFTIDGNGNQVKIDAYYHAWKYNLIDDLKKLEQQSTLSERKEFLKKWIAEFEKESPEAVFQTVWAEVNNNKSILNNQISPTNPDNSHEFNVLICAAMDGQYILRSTFTVNTPAPTGKSFNQNHMEINQLNFPPPIVTNDELIRRHQQDQYLANTYRLDDFYLPYSIKNFDDIIALRNDRVMKLVILSMPPWMIGMLQDLITVQGLLEEDYPGFISTFISEASTNDLITLLNGELIEALKNDIYFPSIPMKVKLIGKFPLSALIMLCSDEQDIAAVMKYLPDPNSKYGLLADSTNSMRFSMNGTEKIFSDLPTEYAIAAITSNLLPLEMINSSDLILLTTHPSPPIGKLMLLNFMVNYSGVIKTQKDYAGRFFSPKNTDNTNIILDILIKGIIDSIKTDSKTLTLNMENIGSDKFKKSINNNYELLEIYKHINQQFDVKIIEPNKPAPSAPKNDEVISEQNSSKSMKK